METKETKETKSEIKKETKAEAKPETKIEDKAVALKVILAAAKSHPENAAALWQAARIILNAPATGKISISEELKELLKADINKAEANEDEATKLQKFPALKAEFDYADENGLHSHRTVWLMALTDGRDVKRNRVLPVADRYGYLLTGYCTLRKQIRSFRSSRISNLRTFMEGEPFEPNRFWRPDTKALAG